MSGRIRETAQNMAGVWFAKISAMGYLEILEDRDLDGTFEALQEHVWTDKYDAGKAMSLEDRIAATDRLRGAYPTTELNDLAWRVSEHDEEEHNVRVEAAFEFGVAIGRRLMSGGAR